MEKGGGYRTWEKKDHLAGLAKTVWQQTRVPIVGILASYSSEEKRQGLSKLVAEGKTLRYTGTRRALGTKNFRFTNIESKARLFGKKKKKEGSGDLKIAENRGRAGSVAGRARLWLARVKASVQEKSEKLPRTTTKISEKGRLLVTAGIPEAQRIEKRPGKGNSPENRGDKILTFLPSKNEVTDLEAL